MAALTLTIGPELDGRTVQAVLKGQLGLSSTCIGRLKWTESGLRLNGRRVFTNAVLRAGDILTVELDAAERPTDVPPVEMPLDIVYEDQHLLALNKSAPLAVIPSSLAPGEATLAGGLAHYLGPGAAFHPVNRLDRGTTGLMIVAKNGYIHARLQELLHTGGFFRQYLAICLGAPEPPFGEIGLPIGRAPGSAIARRIDPAGKPALTQYRVLEVRGPFALVELTPRTGRTHQLRVHMAAVGCPLAGDWLYGAEDRALIPRPALHAARLVLTHPVTGERLDLTAPIPADMLQVWEQSNYARPVFFGS